jgi:hypothetical protein
MLGLAARGLLGTGIGRTITGAAIGGGIGLAKSDKRSATGRFHDFAAGATMGGAIGLGTTKAFRSLVKGGAKATLGSVHAVRAARAARRGGAGLFSSAGQGISKGIGSSLTSNAFSASVGAGKLGGRALLAGGSGALRTAEFALNRPRTAAALAIAGGGGIAGAYALANSGPGGSGMNERELGTVAAMSGGPSTGFAPGMGASHRQQSRAMFMDSTFGLVQGLSRGRHR